ncbi:hypothetical protein Q9L58_004041 [Maublancomyces gigas]|uniref:Fungal-type protein kinase domain-containing protein n=1 Tax=Discina gigas TaxID=1032678 RepID=A0ABR3GLY5_9PEZI
MGNFPLLRNQSQEKWGVVFFDIPKFELDPESDPVPTGPSEWLTNALDRCYAVFRRNNKPDIRVFINRIIMDVFHDIRQFQSSGLFKLTGRPSTPTPTPPTLSRLIHAFRKVYISTTVHVGEYTVRITGRFDLGFGYHPTNANATADPGPDPSLLLDTSLVIMETQGIRCDLETGFNQLLVCLAVVHQARVRKLHHDNVADRNSTVYEVLSDGERFMFLCIDNDSQVHRSPEFGIVMHFPQIIRYFRHCLAVIATSSPTLSPQNICMASRQAPIERLVHAEGSHHAVDNDADMDGNRDDDGDQEYDFVGLTKRIFKFRTAECEEEDLLRLV